MSLYTHTLMYIWFWFFKIFPFWNGEGSHHPSDFNILVEFHLGSCSVLCPKLWKRLCTITFSLSYPQQNAVESRGLAWTTCRLPACKESQPRQHPDGVNAKLIPASHLGHTDLINSNSFGFIGWRVSGFRSALPETKPGQLCMLILQMHGKGKQYLCAVTQERWWTFPASSSAACCCLPSL